MADGSDYSNYILTIPLWPSSEADQKKLIISERISSELSSNSAEHDTPHVTFETAFKKLAEGDIFEDKLEAIAIRVDFQNLQNWEDLGYNSFEEKREFYLEPPLIDTVSDEQKEKKLGELFEFLSSAPEEVVDALVALAQKKGATFSFTQAAADASQIAATTPLLSSHPADTPPLWAERTTGREVSPLDWIKMHYGPWLQRGILSRPLLGKLDPALYEAHAKWSKRNPTIDDLKIPTKSQLVDKKAQEFGILTEILPSERREGQELDLARVAMTIAMRKHRLSKM